MSNSIVATDAKAAAVAVIRKDHQDNHREQRMRAASMLASSFEAAVAAGPTTLQCLRHPWVFEYIAWQVEQHVFADVSRRIHSHDTEKSNGSERAHWRGYNARVRALLRSIRLIENETVVASLFEGRLSPSGFVRIEVDGALLPEAQRKRIAEEELAATERAEREMKKARITGMLPFFSDRIRCPECDAWGARYERIPHVGGHHKLGKTPGLGGTDHARIACACPSCGLRWKTEEPP